MGEGCQPRARDMGKTIEVSSLDDTDEQAQQYEDAYTRERAREHCECVSLWVIDNIVIQLRCNGLGRPRNRRERRVIRTVAIFSLSKSWVICRLWAEVE